MAKPLNYSDEQIKDVVSEICCNVIENNTSFKKEISDYNITRGTFYRWILNNDELKELYNYAREIRSDVLFEEIIEIADNTEEGKTIKNSDTKGREETIGDMTNHRRLKVDARKWVVARMSPKKYGDKIDITSDSEKIGSTLIIADEIKLINKTLEEEY